jgi:heterodisulfide reductase subunit A-like polyferredoxin
MARPHSQTAMTDVILVLACSNCAAEMKLNRIEPEKPGHEIRTYECASCGHLLAVAAEID